jgi:hypothetical protein
MAAHNEYDVVVFGATGFTGEARVESIVVACPVRELRGLGGLPQSWTLPGQIWTLVYGTLLPKP